MPDFKTGVENRRPTNGHGTNQTGLISREDFRMVSWKKTKLSTRPSQSPVVTGEPGLRTSHQEFVNSPFERRRFQTVGVEERTVCEKHRRLSRNHDAATLNATDAVRLWSR